MSFVGGYEVPDNPLVQFLAAYGPVPSAKNMYDEFVVSEAKRLYLQPLCIKEDLSEQLAADFHTKDPKTIILTGTAGDGKTYTARRVYELMDGTSTEWNEDRPEIHLKVPESNRTIVFVRDLSEMSDKEKESLLPRLKNAICQQGNELFLVCVNDGHLLKTWREHLGEQDKSYLALKEMLREDSETSDSLPELRLINMSRHCHAGVASAIIDAVTGHPGWDLCPDDCPAKEGSCPILVNREILSQDDKASIRHRLTQLVTLAATDGEHLSIRHLIIIVVNALLGYSDHSGKQTLLDCHLAKKFAEAGAYQVTNPFSHVFGDNLPERQRKQYQCFTILSRFGIGDETDNFFDSALLGLLDRNELPDHPFYGDRIFNPVRHRYLGGQNPDIDAFRQAIRAQRQRLFFMLSDESRPWILTLYHSAPRYLDFAAPEDKESNNAKSTFQRVLVKGINRALTGALTNSTDKLWLIEPSGVLLGKDLPLISVPPLEWDNPFGLSMTLEAPSETGKTPCLYIYGARLEVSATLFEYLDRICSGALPTSFSNQCLQDILNFRRQAIGCIHRKKEGTKYLHLVDTNGDQLQEQPIRIFEAHGF